MKMVLILLLSFPLLLSLDPLVYDSDYQASYQSPEGIMFLSYTEAWDEKKLQELYKELIQNKHGDELALLQEVRIRGGSLGKSSTKGSFHALTDSITLYQGDKYTEVSSFRDTLSHEYGHHFAYHYVFSHHLPFSEWSKIRGISDSPVRWDAFLHYTEGDHKWYPQEIIADDYVLLYGSSEKTDVQEVKESNEPFYLRTQHENERIPNVLNNKKMFRYLEEASGLKIEDSRYLKTPELLQIRDQELRFRIAEKDQIAYKLNLVFYENGVRKESKEILKISSNETEELVVPLEDDLRGSAYTDVSLSIDVLDLNTSRGFETETYRLTVDRNLMLSKR
ncbi:hypothetical protein [Metabacillus idriensis]|uniref:hypothetical protein n=1 Tax=Metabacillus idriensis TaxID=324768 RepID=UPI00174C839E|nr:hypothetical protein [Metabacillus idriensis]